MSLSKRDREFRLPKISYLDFKQLEMDRVLTAFFARLAHNGYPSRLRRKVELSVESFVEEFLEHPEWFTGFKDHPDVVARWVETHDARPSYRYLARVLKARKNALTIELLFLDGEEALGEWKYPDHTYGSRHYV